MYVLFNEGCGGVGSGGQLSHPAILCMYCLMRVVGGGVRESGGQLSHASILCMYCLMRVVGGVGWTTEPPRDPMYVLFNEGCGGGGSGGQLSHPAILCMYCLMRVVGGG